MCTEALQSAPLTVHPKNSRYFSNDKGEIVYLTGSHTWSNEQSKSFDYFSETLSEYGHNFIRYWTKEHTKGNAYSEQGDPTLTMPWQRTGPGHANDGLLKFDINKFDQEYFDRLRTNINIAKNRNQYISIMLFQGWSIDASFGKKVNVFKYHPFNTANNINGVDGDFFNNNKEGEELHTILDKQILKHQKSYIRKIVDSVNEFDNVLYEICNEDPGKEELWASKHIEWQYAILDFLKLYQSTKPKQHPIGLTTHKQLGNKYVFESKADWVSPTQNKIHNNYKWNPPIANGNKVILTDTDHLWGIGGDRVWVWKSFLRGLNPIYMDPLGNEYRGWDLIDVRKNMGHTLEYSRKIDLVNMQPSSMVEHCSTRYCLRDPGSEYLVYQPLSEKFQLLVAPGTYLYEWFNPARGVIIKTGIIYLQGQVQFIAPFSGDAVLYLKNRE